MSAQEHTFTFCQIFFISGGNYTLITSIQYTTMVTHSECEISQSWRTQFSSHGALNLNRALMPPLPLQCRGEITGAQEQNNRRGGDRENQDYQDSGSVAAADDQELTILGVGEDQQDTHMILVCWKNYNLVVEADKEV